MKQVCTLFMLLWTINLAAQTTETISLFKKKDRKTKANSEMPYIDNVRADERTQFFVKSLLPQGDTAKIAQFLASGISPNGIANHDYGITILSEALRLYSLPTVKCLLDHGADPNLRARLVLTEMFTERQSFEFSTYPLERAAQANSVAKMDLLIQYGADITRCIDGVKKAAADKGNTEMMSYIGKKTGSSAVDKNAVATMTAYSIDRDVSKLTPESIDELIRGGADVNAYATNGNTALINVIVNRDIKNKVPLIKALLKNGATINKTNRQVDNYKGIMQFYPSSPLQKAISEYNLEIVKLLVENGADINEKVGGHSPLQDAKTNEIKEYLILKGAK